MDQAVLTDALRARGFEVTGTLCTHSRAILFRVREAAAKEGDEEFVAKTVSMEGLDAKGRAAALQEVSVLRGLSAHPNLIAYRESFLEEESGVLLIVMSLAEDGDVRRAVADAQALQKVIPEPIVLHWLRQMLSGIQHLHSQAVVHRDLKSSNIFLCDNRTRCRIGDFGISRVLESTAFASSCVGTPAYMSPELMRNERYAFHVDMWAIGCVGFELCALKLPFVAGSLLGLVYEVVNSEPNWDLLANYSGELQGVIRHLLRKEVAERPSAEELLAGPLFSEVSSEPPEVENPQRGKFKETPRMEWESPSRTTGALAGSTGTGGHLTGGSASSGGSSAITVVHHPPGAAPGVPGVPQISALDTDLSQEDMDFALELQTVRSRPEFTNSAFKAFLDTERAKAAGREFSEPALAGEGSVSPVKRSSRSSRSSRSGAEPAEDAPVTIV